MALWEVEGNDRSQDFRDFFAIPSRLEEWFIVEDGSIGRFDVLAGVQQFLQTRYTQRDVFVRNAGQMEGIKRHLSCWLTNGLCCYRADRFSSGRKGLIELGLDFFEQSKEALVADAVGLTDRFAGKEHAQVNAEQFQSILLFKFALLLEKFVLFAFFFHSCVFL